MTSTHSYLVSSFHAVKVDPVTKKETPLPADEDGMISPGAGDILRFKNYKMEGYVPINDL